MQRRQGTCRPSRSQMTVAQSSQLTRQARHQLPPPLLPSRRLHMLGRQPLLPRPRGVHPRLASRAPAAPSQAPQGLSPAPSETTPPSRPHSRRLPARDSLPRAHRRPLLPLPPHRHRHRHRQQHPLPQLPLPLLLLPSPHTWTPCSHWRAPTLPLPPPSRRPLLCRPHRPRPLPRFRQTPLLPAPTPLSSLTQSSSRGKGNRASLGCPRPMATLPTATQATPTPLLLALTPPLRRTHPSSSSPSNSHPSSSSSSSSLGSRPPLGSKAPSSSLRTLAALRLHLLHPTACLPRYGV